MFKAIAFFIFLQYQADDPVTLWVNKVGPYNNPQERYNYYSLPFCLPASNPAHKWGGLGEVLGGNELIDSQIDIKYQSMYIAFYLTLQWLICCSLKFSVFNKPAFVYREYRARYCL